MNRPLKTTAAAAIAAFVAAAEICVPQTPRYKATAASTVLKYEFEDGVADNCKIYPDGLASFDKAGDFGADVDFASYSGKGFAYLDQKGTSLSVTVEVPEAGLYELSICYLEPSDPNKKVQYLNVNGVNQGEVTFPYNKKFEETSGGVVSLKEGKNVIQLKAYWGYAFYDYLTLTPADKKLSNLSPTSELSNKNASDSAKRLYAYLRDQYGKHIISGQQEYCGEHNYNINADPNCKNYIVDNEEEFEYIQKTTGKQPAIRGIDLLAYTSTSKWEDHAPERAIQWVNEYKGIATLTWHWNVPSEEGSSDIAFYVESTGNKPFTTFSISRALEEGTWENEVLMKDIDVIAAQLKKLKDADVPVLWRPLHEAEGAWFWWGAEGAEPCKKLYRLLYDKLTNDYGLDNLIWVWTGSTSPVASEWYPGDDVVDIVGYDKYNAADGLPNLSSIASTFYSLVQGVDGEKMVAMTENDTIPSLENLVNDKAAWLYFCPWYKNYLTSEQNNPADNLKEIYTSDYCITLDELPDLKSYPIGEPETPTTPVQLPTPGDADLDGEVKMNDVVLVMQSLSNPDRYGLNGSEDTHITPLGKEAADVYDKGNSGLTAQDALQIQKFLLEIVKSL